MIGAAPGCNCASAWTIAGFIQGAVEVVPKLTVEVMARIDVICSPLEGYGENKAFNCPSIPKPLRSLVIKPNRHLPWLLRAQSSPTCRFSIS